ncbi:hypothetical protein C2869_00910 [Saccharobesus litoralis]|uniref:DUF1552 domain-containing protein n=1 Tax=Saccharobesus litoralis TaxID=2172099 RepID=A0A2S0VLK7_9ALTE|nr:DUF1552 domain-containing protein [Saccharobesus litoralis]AWB65087.1 hypothetical protein C2869_00910 [Saccharobesus litoralis]
MKKHNLHSYAMTRRNALKTLLASGFSKALLSSSPLISGLLLSRQAQANTLPNKSIAIYIPGGGIHDMWAPSGSGSNMVMQAMSSSYESVKTDCNFLLNMNHTNAGHGQMPRILSNSWSGSGVDSYDVYMGKQLGAELPFTYVNLGVHSNGKGYLTRDGNTQIPFEDNPFTAFKLLFGANTGGSAKTPILDAHADAVNSIKNQLAGYEVERLNEHLDAISDTQRRLDDLVGSSSCSAAPDSSEFNLTFDTFSQQARLQADIAVAALKCNITRSVSIAFGNHQCEFRIPELNYTGSYHQSIHGGSNGQANYPYYTEMRNHLGSFTAYLIQKLKDENLLNSTVVIETTDMGHADKHSSVDVPLMIAGGGSAMFRGVSTPTGGQYNQLDALHTAAAVCGVNLPYGQQIPGVLT